MPGKQARSDSNKARVPTCIDKCTNWGFSATPINTVLYPWPVTSDGVVNFIVFGRYMESMWSDAGWKLDDADAHHALVQAAVKIAYAKLPAQGQRGAGGLRGKGW
eukprot:1464857-Rhodomonas_salina.5